MIYHDHKHRSLLQLAMSIGAQVLKSGAGLFGVLFYS